MKIAVLTSGILPVPAVRGGAVENLVDFYLEYNEKYLKHKVTVFSAVNKDNLSSMPSSSDRTSYVFFDTDSLMTKINRKIFSFFKKNSPYYHSQIEYYLLQSLKYLQKDHYDVIILENRPGYAEKVAKACPKSKVILHLHNDLLNQETKNATNLKSSLYSSISVSDYIKGRIDAVSPEKPSYVCHNGVDLSKFQQDFSKIAIRKEFGFDKSDFVLVFSGRLIPEKGIKELLEAFLLLKEENIKLLILGGNNLGDDNKTSDFQKELKNLVASCGKRVVFTGFRAYNEMPRLLKVADVAVLPSVWEEPFSLSCLESMACGLPIIATRSGGLKEVATTDCAILLDINSMLIENLAKSILLLYKDDKRRAKMIKASKEQSLFFDKYVYARQFFELLNA